MTKKNESKPLGHYLNEGRQLAFWFGFSLIFCALVFMVATTLGSLRLYAFIVLLFMAHLYAKYHS